MNRVRVVVVALGSFALVACGSSAGQGAGLHYGSTGVDVSRALGCTFTPDPAPTAVPKTNLSKAKAHGSCQLKGTKVAIGLYPDAASIASDLAIAQTFLAKARVPLYVVEGPGYVLSTQDGSKTKAQPMASATGGHLVNLTAK